MKNKSSIIFVVATCFSVACSEPQATQSIAANNTNDSLVTTFYSKKKIPLFEYNNNQGYWESGQLITDFDCQDDVKDFPPVDIKQWSKVPTVNGRLPSYEETKNGTAIHHYGEKPNANVKSYNMLLPKLAAYHSSFTSKDVLVIAIQIAQTATDTVVSFRYPTGGCGGNTFSKFHFLTDDEIKKVTQ